MPIETFAKNLKLRWSECVIKEFFQFSTVKLVFNRTKIAN